MSKSTEVLSGFDFEIGACGVGPERGRQKGFQENFFASVSCSGDPNPKRDSNIFRAREANRALTLALQNTIAASGDHNMERLRAVSQTRSGSAMERNQKAWRSRSLQPRVGIDNEVEARPRDTFVLPQYIGSQYEKKPSTSSGKQRGNDTDGASKKRCHHIECLPHGPFLTPLAILISWAGLALAFFSRQSMNFVSLDIPWHVSSSYKDISTLGVIHAEICYNETVSAIKDPSKVGCFNVALATNEDLNDPIFKLAAIFVSLSVLMGAILTVSMTTTVVWRTINFRAIGTGYLFVYCFQSLAFLFFDTDICESHECRVDVGCMYCIAASVCWITACLICAKMESNRTRADLAKERKRRKTAAAREATRKSSEVRRTGGGTVVTERTTSTISDELTTLGFDRDEELALAVGGETQKQKPAKHSSLPKSRGRDSTARARSPKAQSPRRHIVDEHIRQFDSFQRPLRQSTSGIARQYESIITLEPTGRHSYTGACHTPKSVSSLTSFDDTLDTRYRSRVEYQGKAASHRGRSRSKSRSRARSESRSKAESRTRAHSESRSKAEHQQIDRSKSRGRSSRGRSKNDRPRGSSKTRSQDPGTVKPPRARRSDIEYQAQVASMMIKSERKRHVRTTTAPPDFDEYFSAPISPLSNRSPSSNQADKNIPFVTSYFDI